MKITKLFTFFALSIFILASCGGPSVNDELNDALNDLQEDLENVDVDDALDAEGSAFTSDAGKFTINFPGTPTEETQSVPTEVGNIEMVTFMYEKSATEVYMVAYSDYPSALIELSNAKDLLGGAKDGALGTYGATVSTEKDITIDGNPGMFFKANSDSYYVTYEIYLVDNRLYQIVILKDGAYASESDYNKFTKTFKLL